MSVPKQNFDIARKNFKDPKLMILIRKELDKDHIGDKKEKLLTFLCACSSRLPPKNRVSLKVRGETSEGKTNMVKAVLKHLPHSSNLHWYADGSRFTSSALEDDVKPFNLIVMTEKPIHKGVAETFKQISEDGIKTWKKDPKTNIIQKVEYTPRKSIIDTSTSEEEDEEVANRALIIYVKTNTARHKAVIDDYLMSCATLDKEEESEFTWIDMGLRELKNFDDILIPYAPVIPINHQEARMQRDSKRFFSLIMTSAWINQANRHQIVHKGKKLLIASAEDFYWVSFLSNEAFTRSISGINPKFEDIIKAIDKLVSEGRTTILDELAWVKRADIMEEVGMKDIGTIRIRTEGMKNKGLVELYQVNKQSPVYVRRTDIQIQEHPLLGEEMGYEPARIYSVIKTYEIELIHNLFISNSYPIPNLNPNLNSSAIPNNIIMDRRKDNNISSIKDASVLIPSIQALFKKTLTKIPNLPKPIRRPIIKSDDYHDAELGVDEL